MMASGQPFGLGVTLGVLLGFALGSFLTLWFGESAVERLHSLLRRLTGGDDEVNFELLLQ